MIKYQLFILLTWNSSLFPTNFVASEILNKDIIADYQLDDGNNDNVKEVIMELREYIEQMSKAFQELKLDTEKKLEIQKLQEKRIEEELALTNTKLSEEIQNSKLTNNKLNAEIESNKLMIEEIQKQIELNAKNCLHDIENQKIALESELTSTKIIVDNNYKQLIDMLDKTNNRINNLEKSQNDTKLTIDEIKNIKIATIETNFDTLKLKQGSVEQNCQHKLEGILFNINKLNSNWEQTNEEINNKIKLLNETFEKKQLIQDNTIDLQLKLLEKQQNDSESKLLQNISNRTRNFVPVSELVKFSSNINKTFINVADEIIQVKSKLEIMESRILTDIQNINITTNKYGLLYFSKFHVEFSLDKYNDTFTSYPNAIVKYSSKQTNSTNYCTWTVERPTGVVFIIQPLSMNTSVFDELWVRANGKVSFIWRSWESAFILPKPPKLVSRSNKFELNFFDSGWKNYSGFVIKWTAMKVEDTCKGNRSERVECAKERKIVTKTECEDYGCCYDSNFSDAHKCFLQQ